MTLCLARASKCPSHRGIFWTRLIYGVRRVVCEGILLYRARDKLENAALTSRDLASGSRLPVWKGVEAQRKPKKHVDDVDQDDGVRLGRRGRREDARVCQGDARARWVSGLCEDGRSALALASARRGR